jgi:hypothetical protein
MRLASNWRAVVRFLVVCVAAMVVSLAGTSAGSAQINGACSEQQFATWVAPLQFTVKLAMRCTAAPPGEPVTITMPVGSATSGVYTVNLPNGSTWAPSTIPVNASPGVFITTTVPATTPPGFYQVPIYGSSASCASYGNICYAQFNVIAPTISCATASPVCVNPPTPQLWWFNDVSPNPVNYRTLLQANPTGATNYTWTIVAGSDFAQFSNHSTKINTGVTAGVEVLPKGDPGPEQSPNVSVQVAMQVNGVITNSAPFKLEVRKPKELFPFAVLHHASDATNVTDAPDKDFGYDSLIHYQIRDQTGLVLPYVVPLNEHFTSVLFCDYMPHGVCATNWRRGKNCGPTSFCGDQFDPSNWPDEIQGEALTSNYQPPPMPPGPIPIPLNLPIKIDHWSGTWSVGSGEPGMGVIVQLNDWQKWQNHGRHTNIISPPPQ